MNPQNALPVKAHKPISKPIVVTGIASTVVIGSGAFVLSFSALTDLAVRAGITPEIGWMWPLIVDGMIVAATVAIVALAGREGKEQFYPWILLFFGAVVSTAANAIHAILAVKASNGNVPVLVSALVAAMPPVVLLAITHLTVLLVQYARNSAEVEAALAAAEEAERAQRAAATVTDPSAAAADANPASGAVAIVEPALEETEQTEPAAPAEAPVVEEPAAVKPKPAPKRKPRKPAAAAAAASKPDTPSRPAAASAAKPAAARPAAKSTGATRQLMPELSTVTGVNPLLRAPQAAGTSADTTATPATTASSAGATTSTEAPAGPAPQSEPGSEDSAKELVSAQA